MAFSDLEKLKEFITSRITQQKVVKQVLHIQEKWHIMECVIPFTQNSSKSSWGTFMAYKAEMIHIDYIHQFGISSLLSYL